LGVSNNLGTSSNAVNDKLGLLSDNSIQNQNNVVGEIDMMNVQENDYIDSSNNSISINSINLDQGLS
jgi:hypothetical protein